MTDRQDVPAESPPVAEEDLTRKLVGRIAIAGAVVVALLGGLMVMDHLSRAPSPAAPPVAKAPETPTLPIAEAEKEPPADEKLAANEQGNAVSDSDTTEAPPLTSDKPVKPLTEPATPHQASLRPSPAAAPAGRTEPGQTLAPPVAALASGPRHAPASRPLSQPPVASSTAAVPVQSAQVAEANRQFVVQMGVFNNVANAEELRAKLELAGIPAQIEARVKVGPFATREEAEAARKKLASLGLDPGYLTATRK